MTRLKRITNKIFGNTASTTGSPDTGAEIGQFGSAKAGTYNATADVETIQALPAYEQGWIGAVIPDQQYPTLPEMTGVNKVLSYQTGYLMQEGIPEWDSGTTYYKNSIVKYAKVTTTQTTTVSIGASTGITSASVNKNTFVSQISVDGNYTFTYNGTSWLYNNIATDLNIYGITYTGTPAENDTITVTLTTTTSIGNLVLSKSLTDDNKGNNPTDKNSIHWEVLNLGGGSGLENKITNCILEAPNGVATYSGSTITIKAGLKVLIPNGRNADGTLNNIEYTTDEKVYTEQTPRSENEDITIAIDNNGRINTYLNYFSQEENPNTPYTCWYKPSENNFYTSDGQSNFSLAIIVPILFYKSSNLQITNVIPYSTVDLLKRSNKSEISGWGMPSNKYIDLTLGASGTPYTAPANGYFNISANTANLARFDGLEITCVLPDATGSLSSGYVPVKKGETMYLRYNSLVLSDPWNYFRFIYAEGSK